MLDCHQAAQLLGDIKEHRRNDGEEFSPLSLGASLDPPSPALSPGSSVRTAGDEPRAPSEEAAVSPLGGRGWGVPGGGASRKKGPPTEEEMLVERIARSEAEAMYMALYHFLEDHHDHLKAHEGKLSVRHGHGHGDGGHKGAVKLRAMAQMMKVGLRYRRNVNCRWSQPFLVSLASSGRLVSWCWLHCSCGHLS